MWMTMLAHGPDGNFSSYWGTPVIMEYIKCTIINDRESVYEQRRLAFEAAWPSRLPFFMWGFGSLQSLFAYEEVKIYSVYVQT